MKKRKYPRLDFIASLMLVFDVDWDAAYEDDGFRDIWGRDAIEDIYFGAEESEDAGAVIAIPRHPRASGG